MFKTDPIAPLSFTGNKITLVKQTSSEDEIINTILSLSTFDVTKISPEIIEVISNDWSYFTSKTLEVFSTTCPTITPKSLIAFIFLGRMVAILENRKKNKKQTNSPISIFQRRSIFNWNNYSSTNFVLLYIQIPDLTNEIRLVNYLFNLFNMNHFNIYDVILWSLQLTILSENMTKTFPSFEEIKKMPNHIPLMGEKVIAPQNTLGFAIIRYLYNKIFCTHVNFPFKLQEVKLDFLFNPKIDDHLCWKKSILSNIKISSYLYANSFPNLDFISFPKNISKIPIGIFTIILLNSEFNFSEITQDDVDYVMNIIKSSDLPYQSLLLLLHYSSENELFKEQLETIISDDSLSESWSNAKSLLLKSKNRAVERYISKAKNGDIKAAKKLCYFPECYEEIKEITTFPLNYVKMFFDANNIHQNLEVKSEPTLENAILLYKLFQNNLFISNDSYLPLIKNCHSIILKAVHDAFSLPDAEWIMSGCSTFSGIFYLPKYQADLIFEQKGDKAYISFLNAFFASKCLEKKLPEISEVADFFTCSFLNHNFLSDFFNFSQDEIRKTKLSHIEAAFKADKKIFIDKVINNVERTNNSLSVIVEVLAKHDAYDIFLKIISNDISFLQYFANSSNNFECDFILRYLTENNLQEKSLDDLLQIMNQILIIDNNKTDEIVYKAITSTLEKDPETALKIIKIVPLKKTFAETILSNIQNIPSPISIEYLAFIREVVDMLDKVQCQSSFTPMKALTNEWNEDIENRNSNKRKQTIWDFPDDIGECTFIETGKDYQSQPWFHCNTCGFIGNSGICLPCALRCHRHHDITYAKISNFFCDCYEKIELCKFHQDKYKSNNEIENDEEALKSTTMPSETETAERRSLRNHIEQQIMKQSQQQRDMPTTNPNATPSFSYKFNSKFSFSNSNEYAYDDTSEGYFDDQILDDVNNDRNSGYQQAPVPSNFNKLISFKSRYQPQLNSNSNSQSIFFRSQPNYSLSNNPAFSFITPSQQGNSSNKPLKYSSYNSTKFGPTTKDQITQFQQQSNKPAISNLSRLGFRQTTNNTESAFGNSSGLGFGSRPNNTESAFGNSSRLGFGPTTNNTESAFGNSSGLGFGPTTNNTESAFGNSSGLGFRSRRNNNTGSTFTFGNSSGLGFGPRRNNNTGSTFGTSTFGSRPDGNTGSFGASARPLPYGSSYLFSKNKYASALSQSGPSQIRMIQDPINVLTGIMIISKMLNVKVTPPPPLKNNLTTYDDVKSIKLNEFQNCEAEQFAHFENSGLRCIDSTSFFLAMNNNSISQMNICAAIGSNFNKVIVCEGQNAKVYDIQTNQMLSSCEIKIAPLRITVSELDGTIFAISSMYQVYVYSLNESNGQIELNNKIELMLEELGRSLSIVSVDWVPLEPLHLAITCTNFVKIYDIPSDCISPIACFTSKNRISSSFLTVYDDEPYVFVACNNDKIYYNKCNVDGPCAFTNAFIPNLSNFINLKSITISYCKDSDLLFISSIGSNLLVSHLNEMMNQQDTANEKPTNQPQKQKTSAWTMSSTSSTSPTSSNPFCSISISGRHNCLEFVGVHPDVPSIFILRDRINGDVILVEFSSKGVSNFAVNLPILPIHFINSNVSILGTFISCGNMYAIGSDCYLYKLVPGKHQTSVVMKLKLPPEIPKVSADDEENDEGNNRKGKKSKRNNDKKKQIDDSISIDDQNQSLTSRTADATPAPSNSLASVPSQSASSTTFSIQASPNNSSVIQLTNANNQSSEFTETNPTLSSISNSAFSFSINSSGNFKEQIESIANEIDEDDDEGIEEDNFDIDDEDDDEEENSANIDYHYILSNRGFQQNSPIPNMGKDISKLQEERALRASKLRKGEIDGFSFEVPATFWIKSRIETSMMKISDHNHNDCTQLIFGRRQTFNNHVVTLNITSLDSKNMIVGFKLCFNGKRSIRSKPESVKIFNRRYVSTQSYPRDFCLPLKESEVGINKSYNIEMVSHSIDIDIDGVDIFVIDATTTENQDKKDWINDASFITDFIDVSEIKCENDVDYIIQSISAANFLPLQSYSLLKKKDENKENIDDIISKEDIELKKLFIWMYTNSKISLASRRILIKSLGTDVDRFEKLCTIAIIEICDNKGPDEKLKNLMWRDYAFLPQSQKNKIGDSIWKFYDNCCGALGFSSAFLFGK